MKKTAVIYARFSCGKQREASIEDQLRVCGEWCEREGYRVVARYCDHAISGRTDARPQFQKMMDNAGESDVVVVYMMDRFSRDVYDAPIYKKRLHDAGVRVVSATESMPDGPEALLLEKIYEGLAAVESAHISARTKRGMEGNALKCLYNGDRVFGYGVDPDTRRYVVDEGQAAIVREVFARRINGESEHSIAHAMAARGVRTYRGKPCSHTMVRNMIRNPRYRGLYKWGDVEVPGGMPAIVSEEDWEMAQNAVVKKQRKLEEWHDYPLVGRALCAGCGRNLVGTSGRGRNGMKYSYYRCGQKCGHVSPVPKDWLEGNIADALRWLVSDRDRALQIGRIVADYAKSSDASRDADRARAAIAEAERGLANIQRAIEMGVFTESTATRISELESERAAARTFLEGLEAYDFDEDDFADFLQYGATLDDGKILDMLVWQVLVSDEEIIVTLNYDVGPEAPYRFAINGFSESVKCLDDDEKKCEPAGQNEFAQVVNGSPYVAICETVTGVVLALHVNRFAIVLQRCA